MLGIQPQAVWWPVDMLKAWGFDPARTWTWKWGAKTWPCVAGLHLLQNIWRTYAYAEECFVTLTGNIHHVFLFCVVTSWTVYYFFSFPCFYHFLSFRRFSSKWSCKKFTRTLTRGLGTISVLCKHLYIFECLYSQAELAQGFAWDFHTSMICYRQETSPFWHKTCVEFRGRPFGHWNCSRVLVQFFDVPVVEACLRGLPYHSL